MGLVLVILAPLIYRAAVVYEWRPDTCAVSDAPVFMVEAPDPEPRGRATGLRIVSWNIGGHATLHDPGHIAAVARELDALDADVIALQEVHRGTWQARFTDQASELARITGLTAVFAPSFAQGSGEYGNMLLVRGKPESAARLDLPGSGEPRSALIATVTIAGQRFSIASTHLSAWGPLNREARNRQAQCLAQSLEEVSVITGDLNATSADRELAPLFGGRWKESDARELPTHRTLEEKIDFVLVPPYWQVTSVRVPDTKTSDHRPVVVDIGGMP